MSPIIQRPAPPFAGPSVKDGIIDEIKSEQYIGKWVILVFYPMDFTFVCPTEILAFNRALPEFEALGVEVVCVSTDSEFTHLAWSQTDRSLGGLGPDLKLTLLADKNHSASKAYNVLIPEEGVSLRGTFFIDPNGTLRASHVHDLPVGRSVEETIRVIKAFQYTDIHGEVCPAGWETGGDTIDTKDKARYFSKQGDTVKRAPVSPAQGANGVNGHAKKVKA